MEFPSELNSQNQAIRCWVIPISRYKRRRIQNIFRNRGKYILENTYQIFCCIDTATFNWYSNPDFFSTSTSMIKCPNSENSSCFLSTISSIIDSKSGICCNFDKICFFAAINSSSLFFFIITASHTNAPNINFILRVSRVSFESRNG